MRLAAVLGATSSSLPNSLHRATQKQAQIPFVQRVRLCERLYRVVGLAVSASGPPEPGSSPEEVVKRITKNDVEVTFARSSGAGGQNVNKVNTKVDMRLNLDSKWISEDMQDALQRLEKKRINKEGELILTSQKTRSQASNVDDALTKMQDCLDRAAESIIPAKPDPEKAKEMSKRKNVANENRIQAKKMKSDKKKARRSKLDY